mmetsp:Transcript_12647/g.24529  ORF Transcript_12647/g.24529 Transcript_12647/m.24529 type:complete len:329 (+) Transcript_12647:81-1067(+)
MSAARKRQNASGGVAGDEPEVGVSKEAPAGPGKSHGPPPKDSVLRLGLVLATIATLDVAMLRYYMSSASDASLDTLKSASSIMEVLQILDVDVDERDVTGGGSKILLTTRVLSTILAVAIAVNIYVTNDYPKVRSNFGEIVHIKRWKRYTTFTVWSWTMLTFYFLFSIFYSLNVEPFGSHSRWMPVVFEVCFSSALMVTLVVHFVLMPTARRKDPYRYARLSNWRALTMHYANLLMMLVEATLSGLPMVSRHWIFMLCYANVYVSFALFWFKMMGIFYYFFMDYTRFAWAPLAYAGLVGVMYIVWVACTFFVEAIDIYVRPVLISTIA